MHRPTKTSWIVLGISSLILIVAAWQRPRFATDSDATDQYRKFQAVYQIARDQYVEEVEGDRLFENAMRGMLYDLDPYSAYYSAEEAEALRSETDGAFGGVGIEMNMQAGRVEVITPIEGTPAEAAGIHSGDWIIGVDGESIEGWPQEKVVDTIRGEVGTEVKLEVLRMESGQQKELTIPIVRAKIQIVPVKDTRILDGQIGYIRLTAFNRNAEESFREAVDGLLKQGIKSLVLDLRFNPGGLLQAAVNIADMFVTEGTIVSMKGRGVNTDVLFDAKEDDLRIVPIAILVNEGSASASEVLSAALRDHERAFLVGEPTFGKALVQHFHELEDGSAVKLTVARYYTPKGLMIQAIPGRKEYGLKPDTEVPMTPEQERVLRAYWRARNRTENGLEPDADDPVPDDFVDVQLEEALRQLRSR